MTLLVWKRKNKGYIIPQNQIRGIIALCLIMAVTPFFYLLYTLYFNFAPPEYSEQSANSIAVEIKKNEQAVGIYFIKPEISANKFLQMTNFKSLFESDFYLRSGITININSKSTDHNITFSEMDAAKKLALHIPLDINKANKDDLILINGIGEKTATNIMELREQKVRFSKIEELMQIRGIKEKRLAVFKKYLYVDEASE
ncbi:MAG: helix-hairpin-helix domain-containing protein [Syntrophaceae bacterium]|nr:helix-hairpin-helix domain-containing protein [Syntrophaceae bacterium]